MDYEVVMLEEIRVAGLSARTCSASPDAGAVIGGLWEKFYSGGVCDAIKGKKEEAHSEYIRIICQKATA